MADSLPADIPAEVADAAQDTLGGALAIAESLPGALADAVVAAAQVAFVDALHLVAAVAAILAALTAIVAAAALWNVPVRTDAPEEETAPAPLPPPSEGMVAKESIPPELFLAGYPREISDLAERLRGVVFEAVPEAIERVRTGWR